MDYQPHAQAQLLNAQIAGRKYAKDYLQCQAARCCLLRSHEEQLKGEKLSEWNRIRRAGADLATDSEWSQYVQSVRDYLEVAKVNTKEELDTEVMGVSPKLKISMKKHTFKATATHLQAMKAQADFSMKNFRTNFEAFKALAQSLEKTTGDATYAIVADKGMYLDLPGGEDLWTTFVHPNPPCDNERPDTALSVQSQLTQDPARLVGHNGIDKALQLKSRYLQSQAVGWMILTEKHVNNTDSYQDEASEIQSAVLKIASGRDWSSIKQQVANYTAALRDGPAEKFISTKLDSRVTCLHIKRYITHPTSWNIIRDFERDEARKCLVKYYKYIDGITRAASESPDPGYWRAKFAQKGLKGVELPSIPSIVPPTPSVAVGPTEDIAIAAPAEQIFDDEGMDVEDPLEPEGVFGMLKARLTSLKLTF